MGTILKAKCSNCGFEKIVYFGAGKASFKTISNVPAINKNTGEFSVENVKDKSIKNNFIFYNDSSLFKKISNSKFFAWGEIKLQTTNNFCHKCKEFTLNFIHEGYFD